MNARTALNVALLALAAALAWFALDAAREPPADPGLAVTALSPQAVTRIAIERPPRPAVVLERIDGRWRISAPLALPADAFRVRALLGLVETRSDTGFRAAGNDLSQFGLDPPQARLRFDEVEVAVGGTETLSGRRYLASDDQVHLVEDHWFSQIFGDAAAWVDPSPLPEGAAPVRIALPGSQWRLAHGRWSRTPPGPGAERGAALARAWQHARALAVRARDAGLPWHERVEIEIAGAATGPDAPPARTITFEVARSADALLLARPDLGVQYRFLARQGRTLLADTDPPGDPPGDPRR